MVEDITDAGLVFLAEVLPLVAHPALAARLADVLFNDTGGGAGLMRVGPAQSLLER